MQPINHLKNGQKGIIKEISGGKGLRMRLETLNIREGKIVTKISSAPFRGPLVVEVDGCQLALGRGMASKVLVTPI